MSTIKYFPIFKQNAQWALDDFSNILRKSMPAGSTDASVESMIANIVEKHEYQKLTYAFGAFNGSKMVGFTTGFLNHQSTMLGEIDNMFVLPDYARQKIGTQLQALAEKTFAFCSINKTYSVTYASDATLNFMKHNGYKVVRSENVFVKDKIQSPRCVVFPVFHLTNHSLYSFRKMGTFIENIEADLAAINKQRMPAFVYVNENSEICAYAIGDNDGNIQKMEIAPHQPADWIRKRLTGRFEELHALLMAKQGKNSRGK